MRLELPDGLVYTVEGRYVVTTFPDGARLVGDTEADPAVSALRAQALGYPDARSMHIDHALAHHLLARAVGYSACPLLRAQASGHAFQGITLDARDLEAVVLLLQRAVNASSLAELADA